MNLLVAVLGGAVRVGTPFLMVSLAECITEKSGRINLGLEGVLVFSAMAGFGGAYLTGNVWLGVLAAGCSGALLALLHGLVCSLPRVNDIAAITRFKVGRLARSTGAMTTRDRGDNKGIIAAKTFGLPANTSLPNKCSGSPARLPIRPPASVISKAPAATSHGDRPSSKKPS